VGRLGDEPDGESSRVPAREGVRVVAGTSSVGILCVLEEQQHMSQSDSTVEQPLADQRVRSLIGFAGGAMIAVVSVLFLEPPLTWVGLGVAALDVTVTPYLLGKAVQTSETTDSSRAGGT